MPCSLSLVPALAKSPLLAYLTRWLSLSHGPPLLAFYDVLDSAWLLFCFLSALPILRISPQQREGPGTHQASKNRPPLSPS